MNNNISAQQGYVSPNVNMVLNHEYEQLEKEDQNKWELDTNPYLDKLYHELLGMSNDPTTGKWKRNYRKNKLMNEKGASDFIREIESRISIHMQFSELQDNDIIDIASQTAEIFADKLEDSYFEWEVKPIKSNLKSICYMMYHNLKILLTIARNGGMKRHREKSKNPYLRSTVQTTPQDII